MALVRARIAQILVNQLESQLLVGLNEQVSCGNWARSVGFGSFALSGHGRYALTPELTLLGGVEVGQYRQKGANVDLNVGRRALCSMTRQGWVRLDPMRKSA